MTDPDTLSISDATGTPAPLMANHSSMIIRDIIPADALTSLETLESIDHIMDADAFKTHLNIVLQGYKTALNALATIGAAQPNPPQRLR